MRQLVLGCWLGGQNLFSLQAGQCTIKKSVICGQNSEATVKETTSRELFESEFKRSFVTNQKDLADQVWLASQSNLPVLISGPSGSGKELIANAIHKYGPRGGKPLIAVNCGLIPREHIYSELFGVEKGAFSGVTKNRNGHFVEAKQSTIFLDEIGEMPLDAQVGLLRVLETGRTKRLGEDDSKAMSRAPLDVRIIAATNRDVWDRNLFRQDLLHRLNVIPIQTPALQPSDMVIPALLRRYLSAQKINHMDFHFFAFCCSARWEGNVRELKNFCEYSVLQSQNGRVTLFPAVLHHFKAREACPEHIYSYFEKYIPNFVPMLSEEEGIELPFWKDQLLPSELIPYLMTIFRIQSEEATLIGSSASGILSWFNRRKVRRKKRRLDLLGDKPNLCNAFFYKDIGVEKLPDSTFSLLGKSVAETALISMFMRDRYEDEMHESQSDGGQETIDVLDYHRALGLCESQFFNRIFQMYPNLSDSKIGGIIGLDKKTVKERRRRYCGE